MGKQRKRRRANLRRKRRTVLTNFQPTDKVTAEWDNDKREWALVVDSENGVQIDHSRLTDEKPAA
jgi:hypothetical protein